MNKADALAIFAAAIVREILREDGESAPVPSPSPPEQGESSQPQPQFDFDESVCYHGGLAIDRSICPIHGPQAEGPAPTAEELDDITAETHDEANPLIAKAERVRRQREKREANQRLYPEDLPMSGLAGPTGDDPPLVV